MQLLLIDNYDSFTYNLVQYFRDLGAEVQVLRTDKCTEADVEAADAVVLSPGPGLPETSGQLMELLGFAVTKQKPVLGVCLGMQAIALHFGGTLRNLDAVCHGIDSLAWVGNEGLYQGLDEGLITVGRYHSWVVEEENFPAELTITGRIPDGPLMSLKHNDLPVYGVQFHPESVLTPDGKAILRNFLQIAAEFSSLSFTPSTLSQS
ncbi:MAG: aminodeoxychorismate/anthranilate synthase component II [Bacteroidota bacterium]